MVFEQRRWFRFLFLILGSVTRLKCDLAFTYKVNKSHLILSKNARVGCIVQIYRSRAHRHFIVELLEDIAPKIVFLVILGGKAEFFVFGERMYSLKLLSFKCLESTFL